MSQVIVTTTTNRVYIRPQISSVQVNVVSCGIQGPQGASGSGTAQIDVTGGGGGYGTLAGAVNGSNMVFTVSNGSYTSGTLIVYYQGQALSPSNFTETTPASGIFTLGFPPASGQIVMASYATA